MAWVFEPWPTWEGWKTDGEPCPGKLTIVTARGDCNERWLLGDGAEGLRCWPGQKSGDPYVNWHADDAGGLNIIATYDRSPGPEELAGEAHISADGAITWKHRSEDEAIRALVQDMFEGVAAALGTHPPVAAEEVFISQIPDRDRFVGEISEEGYDRLQGGLRSWHILAQPVDRVWRAFEMDPVWWDEGQEVVQAEVARVHYNDSWGSHGLLVKQRDGEVKFWPDERKALVQQPLTGQHPPEPARALAEAINFTA